jgi:mevalonate kinase
MSVPSDFAAVEASAPGKVILLGEHAVVYGAPAIGFPLERRVRVRVRPGSGHIQLSSDEDITVPPPGDAASPRELIKKALGPWFTKSDVAVHFGFPPMSGFGSSAALAVALHHARRELEGGGKEALDRALKAVLATEKVAHAKPSGVDPAICISDRLIWFRKGKTQPSVRGLAPGKPLHFLVGSVGGHGGTRRAVTEVARLKHDAPALVRAAMQCLEDSAEAGARSIRAGQLEVLGASMNLAHGVLSGLGLVAAEVQHAVSLSLQHGALGAKMSGAGGDGGGAFVAVFRSKKAAEAARGELNLVGISAWTEKVRD